MLKRDESCHVCILDIHTITVPALTKAANGTGRDALDVGECGLSGDVARRGKVVDAVVVRVVVGAG